MYENLVSFYFHKNLKQEEILNILQQKHNISIGLRSLQRILSELNLKRKNIIESDSALVVSAIVNELYSSGFNLGYRSMWLKLKNVYGLQVKRETVYRILKIADPEGVEQRYGNKLKRREYTSPGPNFIWHLDGYDKLKRFGFPIHGCVDGFSRLVMWLELATTNNNPTVTAWHFLSTVLKHKVLPTLLRSDKGSENTLIGELQMCLRMDHGDTLAGYKSFIEGKSVHNIRMERFWGELRHNSMDFYIDFFNAMVQKNLFNGSTVHVKCLQFCFSRLIEYDLEMTKKLWNEHYIRKQGGRNHIHGKPYVLYYAPQKYNRTDYHKEVNLEIIDRLRNNFCTQPQKIDPDFQELVGLLVPDWKIPADAAEALTLYEKILEKIRHLNE